MAESLPPIRRRGAKRAQKRQVVGLGAAGGKDNFIGVRADALGNCFARGLELFFGSQCLLCKAPGLPYKASARTSAFLARRDRGVAAAASAYISSYPRTYI
jgi:hypothetical protein